MSSTCASQVLIPNSKNNRANKRRERWENARLQSTQLALACMYHCLSLVSAMLIVVKTRGQRCTAPLRGNDPRARFVEGPGSKHHNNTKYCNHVTTTMSTFHNWWSKKTQHCMRPRNPTFLGVKLHKTLPTLKHFTHLVTSKRRL